MKQAIRIIGNDVIGYVEVGPFRAWYETDDANNIHIMGKTFALWEEFEAWVKALGPHGEVWEKCSAIIGQDTLEALFGMTWIVTKSGKRLSAIPDNWLDEWQDVTVKLLDSVTVCTMRLDKDSSLIEINTHSDADTSEPHVAVAFRYVLRFITKGLESMQNVDYDTAGVVKSSFAG